MTGIAGRIRAAVQPAAVRDLLQELRSRLASMPRDQTVAEIRRMLASGEDASTGLGFRLGPGGRLEEAPTLRTFLLEELFRIDPVMAAAESAGILERSRSPDEWALALRNVARGDPTPAGRELLFRKTSELLAHEPWQQHPSTGFLEAFDAAVFLGGTGLMPALSDLVRHQDNPAVAHASFLALDRLVINDPSQSLSALRATPDGLEGRESMRGGLFARADVRDPRQLRVLEDYLLDPATGPAEFDAFAGVFPSASFMISHNLLTPAHEPDPAALAGRDRESLQVVGRWLQDPRFQTHRVRLEAMKQRLEGFVRSQRSAAP